MMQHMCATTFCTIQYYGRRPARRWLASCVSINWIMKTKISKILLEKSIGIDKRRSLPEFKSQTFVQWFRSRKTSEYSKKDQVVLYPDTTTNFNHPELGIAAVSILEKLGYEVIIPNLKCCGRPKLSNGMMNSAKSDIDFNVSEIYPYISKGAKLVGIEPSCILGFVSDFPDLASNKDNAYEISKNTMLIEEFLLHHLETKGEIKFTNPPDNKEPIGRSLIKRF